MIYTVTFNPCLDYIVGVEDFQLGMTNRTCSEQMFAGGKGINVSIVLKNLGIESTALGFIAGFTGEEIRRKVEKMGITSEFIQLENGFSRINIKLKSIDGTEINGTGPSIGSEELERLLKKLDTLKKGDVLILAGSIPASLPDSIYSDIMERLDLRSGTKAVCEYCTEKRTWNMGTWNSRGLRGSALEELINRTNEQYREKGLALIQKIPTPITPIKIDKEKRHITLAYFDQKSTVDYIGAVQGIPVCFDAKECASDAFALQNIHPHQVAFMQDFEKQGGIAFLLIYYTGRNLILYLPFKDMIRFWERAQNGGRKSFRFEEVDLSYQIEAGHGVFVPYLEAIQKDLDARD